MNLVGQMYEFQNAVNALAFASCFLLCVEYIFIVRVRKPPYPWAAYSVSFVLFALACDRLLKISQPPLAISVWQLTSLYLLNLALVLAALMIPIVRQGTYRRPRFEQLKEIHESLKYSQNLFRSYLDEAPVVAYIKDKDRKVTHANAGFVRLLGDTVESAIGKTDLWGDPVTGHARDLQILAGSGEKEITQTIELKDTACTILDIRFPLFGPDNELMLGGIAVDITNQIKRKNRIEVFASIVELSPDAIYSQDESGRILTWNPAAEVMFGRTREEMIGQSVMMITAPEHQGELGRLVDSFRHNPTASQQFESVRVGKDGVRKPVLVAVACVPGAETTFAVITRDMTQKKQVEDRITVLHDELEVKVQELSHTNISLQKARDEALESASTKSAFVANVSHELRTPLSGILGMSELLAGQSLDQDSEELVGMLHQSAQALLQVVEDVLDLAKLEAGKTSIEDEVFSLNDLVRECTKLFSAAVSAKRLTWQATIDNDVPEQIRTDPSIVKQILCNLLANAIRFTESGGVTLSVSAANASDSALELRFEVSDTGVGIDDVRLPLLFTPFARVSQSTEGLPGTGLGLILCKQLIDLLGGHIGCTSEKGKGSTFWFTAGVGKAETPFPPSEKRATLPMMLPSELAQYRVLSVDDSPVVSRLTMRQLGIIGVQPEAAITGQEAIKRAGAEGFDVILMDVHLPDMTGYEAAREIRKCEASQGISKTIIIALTGCAPETLREQTDAAVMDDFLEKPVTIELLRTTLVQALYRRREK
jgi:two-component system, sensor histidine kinase and response regulator